VAIKDKLKSLLSTKSILTASFILGGATLLSKVTGFLRIQSIAAFFGATWQTDAFLTAFLIPECLYLFFTEGALSSALVPLFTGYFNDPEDSEKIEKGQSLLATLSVIVAMGGILIALFIYLYRYEVAGTLGPEFATPTRNMAAVLLAIICGYVPLGLLSGLFQGYLNSRGHFLAPALGPVLFNVVTIGSAFLLASTMGIKALAWAVLVGGLLAFLINLTAVKLLGTSIIKRPDFRHEGLGTAWKLLIPVLFSLILVQTQICVERMMASSLSEGSVSSLNFASKILNLPAGLLALTIATALLPSLSRAFAANKKEQFISTACDSHNVLIFLVAPIALIMSLCSEEIVSIAFQRGAFNMAQAKVTAGVLFYYALSLIPVTGTFLLTRVFFATRDTRTPALVKMVATTFNIVLLSLIINHWGIVTIPTAFMGMYVLNYGTLLVLFGRSYPGAITTILRELVISLAGITFSAIAYSSIKGYISIPVLSVNIGNLILAGLVIPTTYLPSAYLLRSRFIEDLKRFLPGKKKLTRPES
jgi:putative peptidoglycan lipid II flippase